MAQDDPSHPGILGSILTDGKLWAKMEWGLADPDQDQVPTWLFGTSNNRR